MIRHALLCLIISVAWVSDVRAEVSDLLCIGSVMTGNDADPAILSRTPLLLVVESNAVDISFGAVHKRLSAMHYSDQRVTNDPFWFGVDAFLLRKKTGELGMSRSMLQIGGGRCSP